MSNPYLGSHTTQAPVLSCSGTRGCLCERGPTIYINVPCSRVHSAHISLTVFTVITVSLMFIGLSLE